MLADTCEIFADGDWVESKDQSSEGIRLIQTGNVGEGVFKDRGEKARYISGETFKRLRCTEIFEGDCLISRLPDPVGRSCMLPDTGERMITAVDCTIIRFDPKQVIPAFFIYYSQSNNYLGAVDSETRGTTRKRVSRNKLGQTSIPVPSLPGQQRIIGILDEAFEGIATAKANTEKNLQNARAIFESHLNSVFTQRGEGWQPKKLSEVLEIQNGYAFNSKSFNALEGMPLIRIRDLKIGKETETRYTGDYDKRYVVKAGDLLVGMDGEFACYEWKGSPSLLNQRVCRIQGFSSELLPRFLFYGVNSHLKAIEDVTGYATVKHLSSKQILNIEFPLPPFLEQQRIVGILDVLCEETQRLATLYERKLAALEVLKKSLLHQAFTGEL